MAEFTKSVIIESNWWIPYNPGGYGYASADAKWNNWGDGTYGTTGKYGFAGVRATSSIRYAFAYRFKTPSWIGDVSKISISFHAFKEISADVTLRASLTTWNPTGDKTTYTQTELGTDSGRIATAQVQINNTSDGVHTVEFSTANLEKNKTYYFVLSPYTTSSGIANYASISNVGLSATVYYEADATQIISASSGNIGESINIKVTDDGLSHQINYTVGSRSGTISTSTASEFSWNVPLQIANECKNDTSVSCTITCISPAGEDSSEITQYVPNSSTFKPTISVSRFEKVNEDEQVDDWDIFLQGYTKLKYTLRASANYSDIASYEIAYGAFSIKVEPSSGTASISVSETTDTALSESGTYKCRMTVTDTRGYSSTSDDVEIEVLEYSKPSISAITMERREISGLVDRTDFHAVGTMQYSSIVSRNSCSMWFEYKERSSEVWTVVSEMSGEGDTKQVVVDNEGAGFDGTVSFNMRLGVRDTLGNIYYCDDIAATSAVTFNLKPTKDSGACFGGYSSLEKTLEIASTWDFKLSQLNQFKVGDTSLTDILGNMLYPIGAYFWTSTNYTSAQAVHDALGFGTWEKLTGRFLFAADNSHAAGTTGGSATVSLTESQMPSHKHTGPSHYHSINHGHGNSFSVSGGGRTPMMLRAQIMEVIPEDL